LKTGEVRVVPETEDDLWLLQMVIGPGDVVVAKTTRDVSFGDGRSSRIPMVLAIRVKNVEFEPFTTRLRIHGIVVEGPERFGVKGSHHTLHIDLGNELAIIKKEWSRPLLDKLEKAVTRGLKAIVVALDYDEYSIAIVQEQGLKIIDEGSLGVPGKDAPNREEVLNSKIKQLARTIIDTAQRYHISAVIIASPGFIKDLLVNTLKEQDKSIRVYKDAVSIGGRSGIYEILRRDIVREVLKDVSSIEAEKILDEFMLLLVKNPDKIAFGLKEVLEMARIGAVEKLLVLDELVRSYDIEERKVVEEVLKLVDKYRGEVKIVSSRSPAGEKLRGLNGIIAILRYSVSRRGSSGE